jgi:hypothetical protein
MKEILRDKDKDMTLSSIGHQGLWGQTRGGSIWKFVALVLESDKPT